MKKSFLIAMIILLSSCLGFAQALAVGPNLVVSISGMKEVPRMVDGKAAVDLVPATDTKSGDIIIYTVAYRNDGDRDAIGVTLHDPVPQGTAYIDKSAGGKNATALFSIDGGKNYSEAPMKNVPDKSGAVKPAPASPEEYTDIQWKIGKPVKPKEEANVWFKVRVR